MRPRTHFLKISLLSLLIQAASTSATTATPLAPAPSSAIPPSSLPSLEAAAFSFLPPNYADDRMARWRRRRLYPRSGVAAFAAFPRTATRRQQPVSAFVGLWVTAAATARVKGEPPPLTLATLTRDTILWSCCDSGSPTERVPNHSHHHEHEHHHGHGHDHGSSPPRLGLRIRTALSVLCWLTSMLPYVSPGPSAAGRSKLRYAGLGAVALGVPPIASRARRSLFDEPNRGRIDASCLMLAASLGSVALGDYAEAAAVASLFAASEALEERAADWVNGALSDVARDIGPGTAHLLLPMRTEGEGKGEGEGGSESTIDVNADRVGVGSAVSVPVGDKVPCDGVVLSGRTAVDESSLTGESRLVRRGPGDAVPGGGVNAGPGRIVVRTTRVAGESVASRLAAMVDEARGRRSPTERLVDDLAGMYAPPVFFAALAMATIPWACRMGVGPCRKWTRRGLVTCIAACPCPLVVSTPVTYVAGLAAAAREGIIVKGGAVLEALGRVESIALDKTGTITEGKFALHNLSLINDLLGRDEVMEYLTLMETPSSHPLACALVAAAAEEGVTSPTSIAANHTILDGEGVVASISGKTVHVGNARLFKRLDLYDKLPRMDRKEAEDWAMAGETVGFMSIEGAGIVCAYSVADRVRPEARPVISQFHDLGIKVSMLTGDGHEAATLIGDQVGLPPENIHSQLLPEDKLSIISTLKQELSEKPSRLLNKRRGSANVLMCGDGVNDAPALALADVGVAMGTGAALAVETSDVTMTDSNLSNLLRGVKLGKRTIRTIMQNFIISLGAKALVVLLAVSGVTKSLWAAIASDVGTMLIVTTNGMKLLPSRRRKN